MALRGTDLALVSARVGVARIGAFRLGFYPEDVEGVGTVGPGEYSWRELKPEDDGQEWQLVFPWSMCTSPPVAAFSMANLGGPGGPPPGGGPTKKGRLLVTCGGASGFMWNWTAGYPNWGFTQNTVTENEKTVRAALKWLAGKDPPYNIILLRPVAMPALWGTYFQDFVTRSDGDPRMYGVKGPFNCSVGLGSALLSNHVFTTGIGWTNTDWDGINPFDYDVVLCPVNWRNLNQLANINQRLDYYLANRGAVWSFEGYGTPNPTAWSPYGHHNDTTYPPSYMVSTSAPDNLFTGPGVPGGPVAVPEFGIDAYQYGVYSSRQMDAGSNVMGGTCNLYGATFMLWEAAS